MGGGGFGGFRAEREERKRWVERWAVLESTAGREGSR